MAIRGDQDRSEIHGLRMRPVVKQYMAFQRLVGRVFDASLEERVRLVTSKDHSNRACDDDLM